MTVRLGADGETSDVNTLRSLGATFISRYLSDFPSKNLTLAEAQRLTDAGIDIVSNWEDDVNSWQGGYNRGVQDATRAWGQHKACGGPDRRPIYFSVDTDCNPQDSRLHAYFQGCQAGLTPGQVGVYGSTGVCNALRSAGHAALTWRTMSTGWNGGVGDVSMFNVEQTGYFNGTYDRDASITDDFGQWRIGWVPGGGGNPPAPALPVVSLHIIQMCAREDPAKPQGQTTNSANVLPVEKALYNRGLLPLAYVDGAYGTLTVGAYAQWQRSLGYIGSAADGIPGFTSLTRLGAVTQAFTVAQ